MQPLTRHVQEPIAAATRWIAFEPNDERLWARIRLQAEDILHQLFVHGELQGDPPQAAYFVKCDGRSMTQADIDAGTVSFEVGFAAERPGQFVVVRFHRKAGPPAG